MGRSEPQSLAPYLEIVLAGIVWGSSGVFIKMLGLPPALISFFRLAVPTLLLAFGFLIFKKSLHKHLNRPILFASAVTGARTYFYMVAFSLTSIGNAIILFYTWPIFVMLFGHLIGNEKISGRKGLFAALAFAGVLLMLSSNQFSFGNKDFVGMIAMLLSAMGNAVTTLIFKKQLENISGAETIFYQNFLGALIFLPFLFINLPALTLGGSALAIVYAVIIGVIGFLLFFAGLKRIRASTASVLSYIEVLSAMIFAFIVFNEQVTLPMVVGGTMILLSSFLIRNADKKELAESAD